MEFISNSSAESVITEESAYRAVRGALLAAAEGAVPLPPVIRGDRLNGFRTAASDRERARDSKLMSRQQQARFGV